MPIFPSSHHQTYADGAWKARGEREREKQRQVCGRGEGESYVSSLSAVVLPPEAAAVDQARAGEATRAVPLSFPALPDASPPTYTTEGGSTWHKQRYKSHETLLH